MILMRAMGLFFWLFTISLHRTTFAADLNQIQVVGNSTEWKSILQYQKNFLGFESSEVAGDSFFLSKAGKNDPVEELKSTLEGFQQKILLDEKGDDNAHPICRFPARFEILKKYFDLSNLPLPHCDGYQVYRDRIQTRKVSVVFSSYYAGSASSVFGHSFLKFSGDNENELFDTGINFSAQPTTNNAILYSIYGLIGVFPARFSAQPFYYKVREYNDYESRDLWSYELALREDQKKLLIAHLWELGNTFYHYYYFNENCSYQILRAIEGAIPEIRFFQKRPIYLIPSESIKLLYDIPNLVSNVTYRPSMRNVAYAGYDRLSDLQKSEIRFSLQHQDYLPDDAKTLDVLMDSIDLNEAEKLIKKDPSIIEWKERVLQKRAMEQDRSEAPTVIPPSNEEPHLGHGSRRISLGYDRRSLEFKARASHHDLLDPSIGYPRNLHIDFGRIGFRYTNDKKQFLLDELTLVDLTALSMEHDLYSRPSYLVKIGFDREWIPDCSDPVYCPVFSVKAGIGKTYSIQKDHFFYGILAFQPEYIPNRFGSKFNFGIQPSLNFVLEWLPSFKSQLQLETSYLLAGSDHWRNELRLENRFVVRSQFGLDLDLGSIYQGESSNQTIAIKGLYYF